MCEFYITPEEYEIARKNGINEKNLNQRIRDYGWTKEKAMTAPIKKQMDRKYWAKIAEENGIHYNTFLSRIHSYGWNDKKAASKPLTNPTTRAKELARQGKKYSSQDGGIPFEALQLAKENGISYQTMFKRIKRGIDPVEAATKEPDKYWVEHFRVKE